MYYRGGWILNACSSGDLDSDSFGPTQHEDVILSSSSLIVITHNLYHKKKPAICLFNPTSLSPLQHLHLSPSARSYWHPPVYLHGSLPFARRVGRRVYPLRQQTVSQRVPIQYIYSVPVSTSPNLSAMTQLTSAARAAAARASAPAPPPAPPTVPLARSGVCCDDFKGVVTVGALVEVLVVDFWTGFGTDARAGCCPAAAAEEPRTRPGWEKGSDLLAELEQRFPMAAEVCSLSVGR